jgi:hypothetical protein
MSIAIDLATVGNADACGNVGCAYVTKIGTAADLYKVGKAKDYEERLNRPTRAPDRRISTDSWVDPLRATGSDAPESPYRARQHRHRNGQNPHAYDRGIKARRGIDF